MGAEDDAFIREAENYANASSDTLDIAEVYAFLDDQNRPAWQKKLGYGVAKMLVYITGGFGGGQLLAQIHEMEERDRQNGTI